MGYEQSEPVAVCDGCGKALYEGDEAWTCYYESDLLTRHGKQQVIAREISNPRDWAYHYCCPTPCLERAVVSYVRSLRPAASTEAAQTRPHPEPRS